MEKSIAELVYIFKKKYPGTISFRDKKHCQLAQDYLNPGEIVRYAFIGQKNDKWYDILSTHVFVITNKRLLIARKRVLWGHFMYSITPDMFNDLTVYSGLFFGNVKIDTIKELVHITNLSKKCLDEIETKVTEYMIKEKKKYGIKPMIK